MTHHDDDQHHDADDARDDEVAPDDQERVTPAPPANEDPFARAVQHAPVATTAADDDEDDGDDDEVDDDEPALAGAERDDDADDDDDDEDEDEDDAWDRAMDEMEEPGVVHARRDDVDGDLPEVATGPAEIPLELIDKDALWVVKRLRAKGYEAYLTGGCVRDLLLGRRPKDFDVATAAHPNQVRSVFRNCRLIGRRFRLAHVLFPGGKVIETATFRANPLDLADDVPDDLLVAQDNVFGDVEQDARRRDLTVNGLFYDPLAGKVLDYVDGRRDLDQRLIRTIGDPEIRFQEDPVRIIRAIKFATRLEFEIEDATFAAMKHHVEGLARCAPARLQEELMRLLMSGHAEKAFALCEEVGVTGVLLPEIESGLLRELSGRSVTRARVVERPVDEAAPAAMPAETEATAEVEGEAVAADESAEAGEGERAAEEPVRVAPAPLVVHETVTLEVPSAEVRRARLRGMLRALDDVLARGADVDTAVAWAAVLYPMFEAFDASTENAELWLDETMAAWTERIRFTRRDKDGAKLLLMGLKDLEPERRHGHAARTLVSRASFRDLLLLATLVAWGRGDPLDEIAKWKALARHYEQPWRQPKKGERVREPRRNAGGGGGGGGGNGGRRGRGRRRRRSGGR